MEVGYSLIPLVDESSGGNFIDRVVMFRRQFVNRNGNGSSLCETKRQWIPQS